MKAILTTACGYSRIMFINFPSYQIRIPLWKPMNINSIDNQTTPMNHEYKFRRFILKDKEIINRETVLYYEEEL